MPNSVQSALVNPLDPSSCEACLLGPNALMPALARSSTMPAASGVSGPTTTRSTTLVRQNSITAAWSAISSATHSASRAMPALPGAHQSFVTKGDAAIFHARACSRPPEPSKRMCMTKPMMVCGPESGRTKLPCPARGDKSIDVIPGCATWRRPGIHTPDRGYGFRARSLRSRPGMTSYEMMLRLRLPRRGRDDFLQRRDVAGEGAAPRRGGGHRGLRLFADKGLFDRDIACFRQRFDMGAKIPVGGAGELFQLREFQSGGGRQRVQRRHDSQAQGLMDDVVELRHGQFRRIQRPPRMSPPPLTTAIHRSNQAPTKKYPIKVSAVMPRPIATKAGPTHNPAMV